MKRSIDRILTSHAGSLPRPADLLAMNQAKQRGEPYDAAARAARIRGAVPEVVRKQVEAGVDIVGDGEYGKTSFLDYIRDRIGGYEKTDEPQPAGAQADRRDRRAFPEFYEEELAGRGFMRRRQVCTGPIEYTGRDLLQADIDNFKAALQGVDYVEAFMTALTPQAQGENRYYPTQEEYLIAQADAMRVEYQAIVEAGFILQIDDPGLPAQWDTYIPEISVEEYRKIAARRVELLNYALRDLPENRIRHHICWGSWHGPHVTDLPFREIVDLVLQVKAQQYSFEAANARHEHEWKIWKDVKLPEGKILMPGVVGHASNVVEHPELVAERIVRFASLVGRENVVAGTDCGLGGRLHPQIAWAKLKALSEGAALASKELWPA